MSAISCLAGRTIRIQLARCAFVGFVLGLVVTSGGCNFVPKSSSLRWPWSKEKKKELPERILPVWTDSVLYQPNQPGVRGFGGRVYFYVKDGTDPVEVDGGLAVYVFDADDENHDQKPLRKFAFTPEQFAGHMSHTSIGPSYSVWLPWGEVGGPPRKLSLIARFEGSEGGTVISDPTIKLLPGVAGRKEPSAAAQAGNASSPSSSPFRLTGHSTQAAAASSSASASAAGAGDESSRAEQTATQNQQQNRSVGTIDLPPSFQRHLFNKNKATGGGDATFPASNLSPTGAVFPAGAVVPAGAVFPAGGAFTAGAVFPIGAAADGMAASSVNESALLQGEGQRGVTGASLTTEVTDHRSRMQQSARAKHTFTGEKSKTDIRAGRWIEAPR